MLQSVMAKKDFQLPELEETDGFASKNETGKISLMVIFKNYTASENKN